MRNLSRERKSKQKLFIFSLFLILALQSTGTAVKASYISNTSSLEVNPFVISHPTVLSTGLQSDFFIDSNNMVHVVTTQTDLIHYSLIYTRYSLAWEKISEEQIFERSSLLFDPQILVGDSGSVHILIGVEDLGYFYLFSNNSVWYQQKISTDTPVGTIMHFSLDSLNQPHFTWIDNSTPSTLNYMYPKYTFLNWTESNSTYYNSTLMDTSFQSGSNTTSEFILDQTSFAANINIVNLDMAITPLNHTLFFLQTQSTTTTENSSPSFQSLYFLRYDQHFEASSYNTSDLIEYNLTSPENYTTQVDEWSNHTYSYLNQTEGEFQNPSLFLNGSLNEIFNYPHLLKASDSRYYLSWYQSFSGLPISLNAMQLNTSYGILLNSSFTLPNYPFINTPFRMQFNDFGGLEVVCFVRSSENNPYLLHLRKTGQTWVQNFVSALPNLHHPSFPFQVDFSGIYQTIFFAKYQPSLAQNQFSVISNPSPRFSLACNISSYFVYNPSAIPNRVNDSIDPAYSSIILSDQKKSTFVVDVSNYYSENQSCDLTFELASPFHEFTKGGAANRSLTLLEAGRTTRLMWEFGIKQTEVYQNLLTLNIYSSDEFMDSFQFQVIIVPGINFLAISLYSIALVAFASSFLYYKKMR